MTRTTTLAAVAMLVLAAMAGGVSAVGVDSESADTSTTSDLTDGTTLSASFEASENASSALEITTSSTSPEVNIIDPESNLTVRTYAASQFNQTFANSSNDHYHYRRTISHDELRNVPVDAGETKNVTIEIVNNDSAESPATTEFNVSITGVDNRTVIAANETDLTTTAAESGVTLLGFEFGEDPAEASVTVDAAGINGSGSEVRIAFLTNTTASAFESAVESPADGSWVLSAPVRVGDTLVKTYYADAPDDASGTYAVYDPEQDALRVHLGSAYEDLQTVSLEAGTEPPEMSDAFAAWGTAGALHSLVAHL